MIQNERMISFSAIGCDTPGLVAKITRTIFKLNGNIVDVEENCRRGLFSIFLVIDFSASSDSMEKIIVALGEMDQETGLKIVLDRFDPAAIDYSGRHENHLVTVTGIDRPGIIAKISAFFYRRNINIEKCRMIARGKLFTMEMRIDTQKMALDPSATRWENLLTMKDDLRKLCSSIDHSVGIQSENIYQRKKKLVVFDVESSLIHPESLKQFISTLKGKADAIYRPADSTKNKEDQMHQLQENAKFLKGWRIDRLKQFSKILSLHPGTYELIRILKSMGFKIALLSSGFGFFVKKIFENAGVDYAFSNTLAVDGNGITTGELAEPVIDSDSKDELIAFIMKNENIDRDQVVAVGDGSRSAHFITHAGLSITFKPGESEDLPGGVLKNGKLIDVLYCLGIPKEEVDKYFSYADS